MESCICTISIVVSVRLAAEDVRTLKRGSDIERVIKMGIGMDNILPYKLLLTLARPDARSISSMFTTREKTFHLIKIWLHQSDLENQKDLNLELDLDRVIIGKVLIQFPKTS